MAEGIRVAARLGAHTCSYCKEQLDDGGLSCTGCATQLHPDCWGEARRCPTIGCEETPVGGLPRQVRCAACAQGMLEDTPPCAACGVRVHAKCKAMIVGCTTEGCDGHMFVRPSVETEESRGPSPFAEDGASDPLTWEWVAELAERDPLSRASALGGLALKVGLPLAVGLGALFGSVMSSPGNSVTVKGALEGGLWGLAVGGAAIVYAGLQGLVGIRATPLTNGGLLTMFLAGGGGFGTLILTHGSVPLAIAASVASALLGGRVFGFHLASND